MKAVTGVKTKLDKNRLEMNLLQQIHENWNSIHSQLVYEESELDELKSYERQVNEPRVNSQADELECVIYSILSKFRLITKKRGLKFNSFPLVSEMRQHNFSTKVDEIRPAMVLKLFNSRS